jgi:hypothetical protein
MDPDVNPRDRRFKRLTTALYHVNTYEHENGRPMIGALVVRASDGLPGDGFYWCARQLGFEFEDTEAAAFWEAELARVSEYWGSQPQETQLDRIEAKLDQILKRLAKPAVLPPGATPTSSPGGSAPSPTPPGRSTTASTPPATGTKPPTRPRGAPAGCSATTPTVPPGCGHTPSAATGRAAGSTRRNIRSAGPAPGAAGTRRPQPGQPRRYRNLVQDLVPLSQPADRRQLRPKPGRTARPGPRWARPGGQARAAVQGHPPCPGW